MFQPGIHTEIQTLVGYIDTQLEGLRESALGLTEDQARATPCRSALSIGGLLKHATWAIRLHVDGQPVESTPEEFEAIGRRFADSFALGPEQTLTGQLAAFDEARAALLAHLSTLDPDGETMTPPAPWDGRDTPAPVKHRFHLVHLVEELARHAGHADIIREEIDGAQALPLHLTATGRPGNPFVQPWAPAAG